MSLVCCLQTEHLDCSSDIRFTSHSCSPNCHMVVRRRQVLVSVAWAYATHTTYACNTELLGVSVRRGMPSDLQLSHLISTC